MSRSNRGRLALVPPAGKPTTASKLKRRAKDNVALYYKGETNHCPACGKSSWLIGRNGAECANKARGHPLLFARVEQ